MKRKDDTWIRIPTKLLCSDKVSTSAKIVYSYMLCKHQYFKSLGKTYFESQDSIAGACSLSRKTVNESISALQKLGYLVAVQKTKTSLHYNVKDVFDVYTKDTQEPF